MLTAEKKDNKAVYEGDPDLAQGNENKSSVMSLSRWELFLERAVLWIWSIVLGIHGLFTCERFKTSILLYKNVGCKTVSQLDMVFRYVAALSIWQLGLLNKPQ